MSVVIKPGIAGRRLNWRRLWLTMHLYLGLSLGLVFVMAGITGSLLVFYVELDEQLNPALQISAETANQPLQSYANIVHALQHAHPQRQGAWRLEMPRHNQAMLTARYYKPTETAHLHFAPILVSVNPYTATVISSRFWGETVMTWLYDLHYTLLLDMTGKTIMAIIGGLLLVSLMTGLYLWWPSPGKWRTALTIKRGSSPQRLVYDLHKINGVYALGFLLLLLLTGILLELPDFFNPLISRISPLHQNPTPQSINHVGQQPINADQAVAIAQQRYPNATLRWLETPADPQGSYRIWLYQHGEPSERFPKTIVWVDQYSGQILTTRAPINQSAGDTFITWLHPLHSGEIAGLTGRWLIFFSGWIPLILYITGFWRWQQKRLASKQKSPITEGI